MAEQRIMTIHLRKAMEAVPVYRRAAAAVKFIGSFVKRHMKADKVKIDVSVNDEVFRSGVKNPPVRMRVLCSRDDKKVVTVSLVKAAAETGTAKDGSSK